MRQLLVPTLLLAACAEETPAPRPAPPLEQGAEQVSVQAEEPSIARPPAILVDTPAHDFGAVSDVHPLEHTFSFMNTGDEALLITEVDAACGCTATELARDEIEGGGIETVGVVWATEGFGPQVKTITLRTNDPARPKVVLTVTASIQPFVRFAPASIEFGPICGREPHRGRITLTCEDPAFELVRFEAPDELTVEVVEGPADGRAVLAVNLRPTTRRGLFVPKVTAVVRGTQAGQVVEHGARFRVGANLYQVLQTDPPLLAVGKVPPGGAVAVETLVTRPDGGAFRLVDARLVGASATGLEVTIEDHPSGAGYRVSITGIPVQDPGPLRGQLVLDTDVPEEPSLHLSMMGMVQ